MPVQTMEGEALMSHEACLGQQSTGQEVCHEGIILDLALLLRGVFSESP